jgi:AAA domain, putative AbiEii toxin, Type IV TA system
LYISAIRIGRFRHLVDVEIVAPVQRDSSSAIVLAGPNGGGKSSVLEVVSYAISNSFAYSYGASRSLGDHSFEVDIGLTPDEARLLKEWLDANPGYGGFPLEELQQLIADRWYTRYFNATPADPLLQARHDRAHNLVQQVLRQQYGRPVGFFLPPDRSYPAAGFEQQKLLNRQDVHQRTLNAAFQRPDFQYRDMLDILIEQQYHFLRTLGQYHLALDEGEPALAKPENPITPYNELLQRLLPEYSITPPPDDGPPNNLWVKIPGSVVIPFSDLSSGEKEVFFILANFIRQDVTNAIVMVDEPELHLHPELARRLVRTMLDIKPGNQIWLATHNPEVFDEVGSDRTFFVSRVDQNTAVVRRASDADEAEVVLKEMFGFSGYIGVGRSLVFLEGEASSNDRKLLSRLFGADMASVKLVPAGGVETVGRINSAVLHIIESGLAWMTFYAIRDRDYLTDAEVDGYNAHPSGRFRVLKRCHIENYLLDDLIISHVLTDVFDRATTEAEVTELLRGTARGMSAEVLAAMVGYRLQRLTWPEDFSGASSFQGVSLYVADGSVHQERRTAILNQFRQTAAEVRTASSTRIAEPQVDELVNVCETELVSALSESAPDQTWRERFPGKRLLQTFAKNLGIKDAAAFHNSIILRLAETPERVPSELQNLMAVVKTGAPFPSA